MIPLYTREQMLKSGELVDVTDTAKEVGINCPVALTKAVWDNCVKWTNEDNERNSAYQDQVGRL